jgi:hypothetical protein
MAQEVYHLGVPPKCIIRHSRLCTRRPYVVAREVSEEYGRFLDALDKGIAAG